MKAITAIVSILIAQSAGLVGSVFTAKSIPTWYATLVKPGWNPPSWVFAPVWTTLYALMGIAAYLIWQNRQAPGAKAALIIYAIQLALNALWSIIFFGLKNPALAFGEILILLAMILATAVLFWRINMWSGILLLPYIAWVSFATFLNYSIWKLN